jgi:hypothetical protein
MLPQWPVFQRVNLLSMIDGNSWKHPANACRQLVRLQQDTGGTSAFFLLLVCLTVHLRFPILTCCIRPLFPSSVLRLRSFAFTCSVFAAITSTFSFPYSPARLHEQKPFPTFTTILQSVFCNLHTEIIPSTWRPHQQHQRTPSLLHLDSVSLLQFSSTLPAPSSARSSQNQH